MKKLSYLLSILLAGILMFSSCTKGWEEMNIDPNNPTEVPPTNILAHVIRATGDAFFDDWQGMNNFLSYAGQVTKIQYTDEARLNERESVINAAWANYYLLLEDLQKVRELADKDPNDPWGNNIKGAALTFSVYLWLMATDQWGYIPFSQALKGETEGITNPAYDPQQDIYYALIDSLYKAIDLLTTSTPTDKIGEGDLLYGDNAELWEKFAGSLLLRIAIRISYVDEAKAAAIIQDIASGNVPVFTSRDEEAKLKWQGSSPYYEPWYANHYIAGRDDHGMAVTFIDTLVNWHDPRIFAFAHTTTKEATNARAYVIAPGDTAWFSGQVEGSATGDVAGTSRIGYLYRDVPDGYTWYLRYAEVALNLAEAYYRGIGVAQDVATAENYYLAGIDAMFQETGEDPVYGAYILSEQNNYLANPKVAFSAPGDRTMFNFTRGEGAGAEQIDDNLVRIWVQKWIAHFKQGQEAWAEMRRTDFPKMQVPPGSQYVGLHNRGPQRYPYPVDEENLNGANLEAAKSEQNIVDDFWGPMWWDTRVGIK